MGIKGIIQRSTGTPENRTPTELFQLYSEGAQGATVL